MAVQVITDSSCDLPAELVDKYGIRVVPLTVRLGEEEYIDGQTITGPELFRRMAGMKELPKTAQPSPAAFAEAFREAMERSGGDGVICLALSSHLSGTYGSACLGRELAEEAVVEVIDSEAATLGLGIMAITAAELSRQKYGLRAIVDVIHHFRERINFLIAFDTLENIVKGGRLSKVKGLLAQVLNIKVLAHNVRGKIEVLEKVRGRQRMMNRLRELIAERAGDLSDKYIAISHGNNPSDAEELKQWLVAKYRPRDVIVNCMGATIGTYAGQNAIVVAF
ncbi:MAG: DegV family protein [Peptococcaceae bacterium]|nr:DegV family protein [Peptococcaceae bacterium]